MGLKLLPLFVRAHELYVEQGLLPPLDEDEAHDFVARVGNAAQKIKVVVGPVGLFASCSLGHTGVLPIKPKEGPEDVRALGQIAKAILVHSIRRDLATQ